MGIYNNMADDVADDAPYNAVDYASLHDALDDITFSTRFVRDSIASEEDHVGMDTLVDLLRHNDLAQEMDDIERLEREASNEIGTESSSQHVHAEGHGQNLQPVLTPAVIRVMYVGAASAKDKRLFFKKISEGLSEIFHRAEQTDGTEHCRDGQSGSTSSVSSSSSSSSVALIHPGTFKEKKHHLVLVSLMPDESDQDQDIVETCQDYGVSIIEADFTRPLDTDGDIILRYVASQYQPLECHSAHSPTLSHHHACAQHFDGLVYPERTPNGIDLCVYFYEDDQSQPQIRHYINEDMVTLWHIQQRNIPILPILSMYRKPYQHLHRRVHERREALASLFAQYKIRGLDMSDFDVGQKPSFHTLRRPYPNDPFITMRLGSDWAQKSITYPAPYQILTVDQFLAIDRYTIFKLLNRPRPTTTHTETQIVPQLQVQESVPHQQLSSEQATIEPVPEEREPHEKLVQQHQDEKELSNSRTLDASHAVSNLHHQEQQQKPSFLRRYGLYLVVGALAMGIWWMYDRVPPTETQSPLWTAALRFTQESTNHSSFHLSVYDSNGNLAWLPKEPPPTIRLSHPPMTLVFQRSPVDVTGQYHLSLPASVYRCLSHAEYIVSESVEAVVDLRPHAVHVRGSPVRFAWPQCLLAPVDTVTPTKDNPSLNPVSKTPTSTPTITTAPIQKSRSPPQNYFSRLYKKVTYLIWSRDAILNLGFTEE